jgi:membrane protein DedA with SNARE-associated domain
VRQRVEAPGGPPLPALQGRLVHAVFALLATCTVASLIGAALSPLLLLRSPLLLLALSPDARHVVLAAAKLAPSLLITLVVLRRALFSVGSFGFGVIYGPWALSWVEPRSPRLGKVLRFLDRSFRRWGPPILVLMPFASLCLLAGAARTRFSTFIVATLVGHTLWVGSTYYLGTLLSDFSESVLEFLSENLVESTLVCVALVTAQQLVARRRKPNG